MHLACLKARLQQMLHSILWSLGRSWLNLHSRLSHVRVVLASLVANFWCKPRHHDGTKSHIMVSWEMCEMLARISLGHADQMRSKCDGISYRACSLCILCACLLTTDSRDLTCTAASKQSSLALICHFAGMFPVALCTKYVQMACRGAVCMMCIC